jgi:hypothetical protein
MAVYLAQRFGEGTLSDDLARVMAPVCRGRAACRRRCCGGAQQGGVERILAQTPSHTEDRDGVGHF